MKANTRKQFTPVKKLLLSREPEQIVHGAELVAALDDDEIWKALLDDVRFERDVTRSNGRWRADRTLIGRLRPGKVFPGNSKSIYWDEAALIEVVARSSHPLRKAITHLSIGFSNFEDVVPPLLTSLSALPNLTDLEIQIGAPIDLEPLAASSSLQHIEVHCLDRESAVKVPAIDSLISLDVSRCSVEVEPMPNLVELRYRGKSFSASGPLASVSSAVLNGNDDYHEVFAFCPNLEVVHVDPPWLKDVGFPAGLRIRDGELRVYSKTTELPKLDDVVGVELVSLNGFRNDLSLDALAGCSELKVLDIRDSAITDLSPLQGHPELRYIAANGSKLDPSLIPADLEPMISYAKKPDLAKARTRNRPQAKPKRKESNAEILTHAKWPVIERDLAGSSADQVLAGVDLAIELGSEAVDYLLSRASVSRNRLRLAAPFSLPFSIHAVDVVGRLLAAADAKSAPAIKLRSTQRLVVEGKFKRHGSPIALTDIHQFAGLDQLVVRNAKSIQLDASTMELRSLVVSGHTVDLRGVSPTLARLMVGYGNLVDPSPVLGSAVQELGFVGQLDEPLLQPYRSIESLILLRERPMFLSETVHYVGDLDDLTFAPVDLPGDDSKGLTDKSWDKD